MIFGTNKYKFIYGIEKMLSINPNFVWNDVKYIEKMDYYIDSNEYAEPISKLNILFLYELPDKIMGKLYVRFDNINNLKIYSIGGKYNQIMGLEIIDKSLLGWEVDQRFEVRDYECGIINFYCETIEIIYATDKND